MPVHLWLIAVQIVPAFFELDVQIELSPAKGVGMIAPFTLILLLNYDLLRCLIARPRLSISL